MLAFALSSFYALNCCFLFHSQPTVDTMFCCLPRSHLLFSFHVLPLVQPNPLAVACFFIFLISALSLSVSDLSLPPGLFSLSSPLPLSDSQDPDYCFGDSQRSEADGGDDGDQGRVGEVEEKEEMEEKASEEVVSFGESEFHTHDSDMEDEMMSDSRPSTETKEQRSLRYLRARNEQLKEWKALLGACSRPFSLVSSQAQKRRISKLSAVNNLLCTAMKLDTPIECLIGNRKVGSPPNSSSFQIYR